MVRTGVSELIPEITQELIDAANITDPELLEVVERLQLSSVMTVPMIARGRTIGALTMVWAESGRHYSEDDLRLGEDLASRAAIAIDNARLYRERDHVARSLQERLLPKTLPRIPGVDVAARYLPAGDILQAGGDFYDLFEMDDGNWKAVIGDVCGKGPEAAALMGFVRFTARAVSRQDTKPSQALVKLNTALLEELETGNGEFCTAAVVRIRPHDEGVRLTVAVAGHPLPLILRANGDVEEAGTPGTVLGVFEEIEVSDTIVELHAGDALVMLTDGVLEAGRDPDWERKVVPRLLASCTELSPDATADRIKAAVTDVDDRRTDDVADPGIEGASLGGRNRRLLGRHRGIGHRRRGHRLRGRIRWRRRRYRCRTGAGRGLGVRPFRPEAAGWRCRGERTRAHGRPPRSVGSCWRTPYPGRDGDTPVMARRA